ncbi:ribosomal protein subunit S26 [Schizosaccharomyces japonicus yFS275]|uniref:Ribosomal protein subunit S26 n=1 Tax=Schizosaccharomyces japonicus (strain yFS275 / FY16936) TaxID=402676 RepID=B6K7S2_SCHJY|nr:ribosomal protein subunit S26 [Schizosaccharomyces japonicus yFS275]EEB09576.1 ribosomal protein subunit S26 [Schizosaccharomyces japonicus yFS275]
MLHFHSFFNVLKRGLCLANKKKLTVIPFTRVGHKNWQKRLYHNVPTLSETNLEPLFSKEGYNLAWTSHQSQVIKALNDRTKGTDMEDQSVFKILLRTASLPEQAATFQYASQAFNNHFFFQSLSASPKKHVLSKYPKLHNLIQTTFGSLDTMLEKITQLANNTFGAAWIWLVMDDFEQLKIIRTFQAGTPFVQGRWQSLDPHLVPETPDVEMQTREYSIVPLLNLCLWQHAYFIDFGPTGLDEYIITWSKMIDWSVIQNRFEIACMP